MFSVRRCFWALLILAALTPLGYGQSQRSSRQVDGLRSNPPAVFALINARVVVAAGEVLDRATVLIRDDRIIKVGADVDIPEFSQVIDLEGHSIYPGLIDSYSETELESTPPSAAYWNQNIQPERRVSSALPDLREENKSLREQGICAQLIAPSGLIINGHSAVVLTNDAEGNESLLADDVAQHMRLTVRYSRRDDENASPNSPMGAVALARQAMYDAQWYADAWQAVQANRLLPRPEKNASLAALQPAVNAGQPVIVDAANQRMLLRADEFAREFGLRLIVRGSGQEYRRLAAVAATNRAILLPVNFPLAPDVSTPEKARNAELQDLMAWDLSPENPAMLHAAGVQFAFTSSGLKKRGDFLKHVRLAVQRGLSAEVALQALTTQPAQLLGVDRDLGRIAPGMLASLAITDGDLFADETKVLETWVAGQRFQKTKSAAADIEGDWKLAFGRAAVTVSIERDGGKYSADVKGKDDKSTSVKPFSVAESAVGGALDLKAIGAEGMARFSFLLTEKNANSASGQILLPDGTRQPLTATRVANTSTKKNSKDSKEADKEKAVSQPASFPVNFPLGAFGRDSIPDQPKVVLFQNAKVVWTSGPQGRLKNASVLVENGKIKAIGSNIAAPAGAVVVDATGMHLSPGIIDCHSHMATDGGVNESAQAVTAEVRIGDFINPDDITIYRQLAGGVTGSNILHGSANPIGGQNQVIKLRWGATGDQLKFKRAPAGIKFALGENVKQSNWGDNFTTRYPQTRMGVEQLFRDAFATGREYAKRHANWQRDHKGLPPRRDLELDAIAEILDGKRWIHCHSYRQDEILALIRVLDDYEITIGTFQHILEGYKVADAMAKHGAMGSGFSDWWAYKFEVYDAIPFAGALMHSAGVVVSYNSDDRELGRHLNQEAAKAMKYGGLPPEDALKFVTLNPAKQLRIDQYTGSIEVGKDADIVMWNESPLSNYARPEQTWIDGRRYFDRAEDAELRKKSQRMRHVLIQKILTTGAKMQGDDDAADSDDDSSLWPRFDEFCSHSAGERVKRRKFRGRLQDAASGR